MNVAVTRCFSRLRFSLLVLLMLLATCFFGGCVRSIEPVLKDDQLISAKDLAGKWVTKEGKEIVEIEPIADRMEFNVTFIDNENKKGDFTGRLGRVNQILIFEYKPQDSAKKILPEYNQTLMLPLGSFMIVQQMEPEIIITPLSYDWFKKYMQQHPGELAVKKLGADDFLITASTEEIQTFLIAHIKDEGAIGDSQTYIRANATTKPAP